MTTKQPDSARPSERGSGPATPGVAAADQIYGAYPGGPSSGRSGGALQPRAAVRGIGDFEALRERLALRGRHRRRVRHAIEVVFFGVALALSTGIYLGFKAHARPANASEMVLEGSGDIDLSDEMRLLLNELWTMEDMERLPRR